MQSKALKALIIDYRIEKISVTKTRTQPKVILTVKTKKSKIYEISEILLIKDNKEICQGLWVNLTNDGNITSKSTLNTLLTYFNKESIEELKNLEVNVRSNAKGYLTIDCTI